MSDLAEKIRDEVFQCLQGSCSCVSHESEESIVLNALHGYGKALESQVRERSEQLAEATRKLEIYRELLTEVWESIGHDSHYIPTLKWLESTKAAFRTVSEPRSEK